MWATNDTPDRNEEPQIPQKRDTCMTRFERYMNVIQGQAVDFVPRVPILMRYAAEYIGSNYAAFASDYRVLAEANLRCAEDFGFDQVSTISDPYRETLGSRSALPEILILSRKYIQVSREEFKRPCCASTMK